MRHRTIPLLLLASGCPAVDTDTDIPHPPCDTATVWPENGATGVYDRTTVEAYFPSVPPEASVGIEGVEGTATLRDDGTLVFTPARPLAPDTTYTATLSTDDPGFCGPSSWTFTTGSFPPVGTVPDMAIYRLDLTFSEGRFIEPSGLAPLLSQYVATDLLLQVSGSGEGLAFVVAPTMDEVAQEECAATATLQGEAWEDPYFRTSPAPQPTTATLAIGGRRHTPIHDLRISGSFAEGGERIVGVTLSGVADSRPLVPFFFPDGEEDAICNFAMLWSAPCIPCPDGAVFCMPLAFDSGTAVRVEGGITPQTQEEACARPECDADPRCP